MTFLDQKNTIVDKYESIVAYLNKTEYSQQFPLYSSMDIRINPHKTTVVDTNLFPAGFNNLCTCSQHNIPAIFKSIINQYIPGCKKILCLAESHTRNKFYLDNLVTLKENLNIAGFDVDIAALLDHNDINISQNGLTSLESASGHTVELYNFSSLEPQLLDQHYDFVLLNNDLIHGIPDSLRQSNIPIYPSLAAGWHSRLKSHHFNEVNRIINHLGDTFDFDPFYFTTSFNQIDNCDINNPTDQQRLYDSAKQLFDSLTIAYKYHNIDQQPFIFLKANSGSYGMSVIPIESPDDLLSLNRKNRNRMAKGKESRVNDTLILQEGIQSSLIVDNHTAELCMYFASQQYLGSFYRLNKNKNNRSNLNSQGMLFKKICTNKFPTDSDDLPYNLYQPERFADLTLYKWLGLISVFAAQKEILALENITS